MSQENCAPAFAHSSGPLDAKIALVGEAWGDQEDLVGKPFIGASGQELTRMLRDAGIDRKDCFLTNVFAFQPLSNNIDTLCAKKKEVSNDRPPLGNGKYLRDKFLPELGRLSFELSTVNPNVIVALGAVACWALLGESRIGRVRGTVSLTGEGKKVLPTYHPAGVLRRWQWRSIVIADLTKAEWHSHMKEYKRRSRWVLLRPTLGELSQWVSDTIRGDYEGLSVDIEIFRGQIEMISFARSETEALVVPFIDKQIKSRSYWQTQDDEVKAWKEVQRLLICSIPKIFQNGPFDMQWIWRETGFKINNVREDTMFLHHAIFPEVEKSLGFLGSLYVDEPAWKLMTDHKDALKREE